MNRIIKLILHLFYWMVFCLFSGVVSFKLAYGFGFIAQNLAAFVFNVGWAMVQFYMFYFIFYRYIERQKYVVYALWSVGISAAVSLFFTFAFYHFFELHPSNRLMDYLPQLAGTFIIGQTGSLLKGFVAWFDGIQHKQEFEKMLLQNELDALNAQLNPHFLFNTLNNIDSLIHSNTGKASEALITLSEIMRYMLYDARKPQVPLKSEIVHYSKIINLQLLRLKDTTKVRFVTDVRADVELAPLLFLPFIENAFKYAILDAAHSGIDIELKTERTQVVFKCGNSYQKNNSTVHDKTDGVGLANIRRRLELLYPRRYRLDINEENAYFSVQLTLEP